MQTARAGPELLSGEEFGAIHPFKDFTSPGRGDVTAPSTTGFKHFFFFFWPHLWQSVFQSWSETKARGRALGGDGHSDPNPALHLLSPAPEPPHSFIFSSKDLSEIYKHRKFLLSYPQPSSAGNEVIHAVHILIYHQQKTSQDRGKSHVLLKPIFRAINQNSSISYKTTSWLLFLRVVFKELWKTFNGLQANKPADLFWKCQNGKHSWKSGLLPCSCVEDLLCANS